MHTTETLENLERTTPTKRNSGTSRSGRGGVSLRIAISIGITAFLVGVGTATAVFHIREHTNDVVASVNGVPITRQAFYHRLELATGPKILQQMVAEETQLQFARKQNLLPSDSEIEAKYAASQPPDFAQSLAAGHQTPEDIKRALRIHLIDQAALTQGVKVTDEEIQNFYRTNTDPKNPIARYYHPETVQVAVIISDRQDDIQKAQRALAAGTPFAQVVTVYSRDASRAANGLLAPAPRGHMDSKKYPGLENRLFGMKVGEQITGLHVANAWWIVRCVAKTPATTFPFAQVQEECRVGAMLTKGLPANTAKMQSGYRDFQKAADIQALWPTYKEIASVR